MRSLIWLSVAILLLVPVAAADPGHGPGQDPQPERGNDRRGDKGGDGGGEATAQPQAEEPQPAEQRDAGQCRFIEAYGPNTTPPFFVIYYDLDCPPFLNRDA